MWYCFTAPTAASESVLHYFPTLSLPDNGDSRSVHFRNQNPDSNDSSDSFEDSETDGLMPRPPEENNPEPILPALDHDDRKNEYFALKR